MTRPVRDGTAAVSWGGLPAIGPRIRPARPRRSSNSPGWPPEEVLDAFRAMPRIAVIRSADGMIALNSTIELMRDLGRPRGDM